MASDHLMPTSGVLRTLNGDKKRERERSLSFRTFAALVFARKFFLSSVCAGRYRGKRGFPTLGLKERNPTSHSPPVFVYSPHFF